MSFQYTLEGEDGEVFANLTGGRYTVTIEATGVNNTQEFADDIVGPIVISGAGSSTDAIGKINGIKCACLLFKLSAACFGRQDLNCDTNGQNCEYSATWRTRGDRVMFRLQIALQGWAAIGFSRDNLMVFIQQLLYY